MTTIQRKAPENRTIDTQVFLQWLPASGASFGDIAVREAGDGGTDVVGVAVEGVG